MEIPDYFFAEVLTHECVVRYIVNCYAFNPLPFNASCPEHVKYVLFPSLSFFPSLTHPFVLLFSSAEEKHLLHYLGVYAVRLLLYWFLFPAFSPVATPLCHGASVSLGDAIICQGFPSKFKALSSINCPPFSFFSGFMGYIYIYRLISSIYDSDPKMNSRR